MVLLQIQKKRKLRCNFHGLFNHGDEQFAPDFLSSIRRLTVTVDGSVETMNYSHDFVNRKFKYEAVILEKKFAIGGVTIVEDSCTINPSVESADVENFLLINSSVEDDLLSPFREITDTWDNSVNKFHYSRGLLNRKNKQETGMLEKKIAWKLEAIVEKVRRTKHSVEDDVDCTFLIKSSVEADVSSTFTTKFKSSVEVSVSNAFTKNFIYDCFTKVENNFEKAVTTACMHGNRLVFGVNLEFSENMDIRAESLQVKSNNIANALQEVLCFQSACCLEGP